MADGAPPLGVPVVGPDEPSPQPSTPMQSVNGRVNECRNARTDMRATVTFCTLVLGDVDFVPRKLR